MCKCLVYVASFLCMVALAAAIVGVVVDYWYWDESTTNSVVTTVRGGLWNSCTKVEQSGTTTETCDAYNDMVTSSDSLEAVKAVSLVGTLLVGLAVLSILVKSMLLEAQKRCITIMTGVIALLGGLNLISAGIVYGTKTRDELGVDVSDMYAGLAMIVVAGALGTISGPLFICARERDSKEVD